MTNSDPNRYGATVMMPANLPPLGELILLLAQFANRFSKEYNRDTDVSE